MEEMETTIFNIPVKGETQYITHSIDHFYNHCRSYSLRPIRRRSNVCYNWLYAWPVASMTICHYRDLGVMHCPTA